jgi:hypothetical protein
VFYDGFNETGHLILEELVVFYKARYLFPAQWRAFFIK